MRARNAGNFLCASCTVPVHTSCSGLLPGPSQACSSRLYSVVPTPVLLVDAFFRRADRRGTSERSHGGRQLLARWEYRANAIFLSRVFLYFFSVCSGSLLFLRPFFAVLSSSLSFPFVSFLRSLVFFPSSHPTSRGLSSALFAAAAGFLFSSPVTSHSLMRYTILFFIGGESPHANAR